MFQCKNKTENPYTDRQKVDFVEVMSYPCSLTLF